ncbi:MAG: dihydroorotate dehydrogenase electron transfer subunit [Planctomycetota bacterium]|nr:dihydroorotate dehydrogenase electron transfer subunit [Planctomycetota bacterium]MDA1177652.1 dihydroorotate dehydrogenase electron transfer subunit [Planctomycetota bacterium]
MAELSSCPGYHYRAAQVVQQVSLGKDTYRLRIQCPQIARAIRVGQFVMVRVHGLQDPLLGRAFAIYDTDEDCLDIAYLVHGKMTHQFELLRPGDQVDIWGPLGNGFSMAPTDHLVMVAGGIGQTPFLAMAQHYLGRRRYGAAEMPADAEPLANRVTLCYGARNAEYFAGLDDFRTAAVELRLTTDDGSLGEKGLVTDALQRVLDENTRADGLRVCACGPERMLASVCELVRSHNLNTDRRIPLEVSLETPMACGIGICFSCVAKIRQLDGSWDYRRTCIEGPVFCGEAIVWD